jgi:Rieske 2Fe-2S family protein
MKDYSLYGVAVGEWGGFVFVNLAGDKAEPLGDALGDFPERFANYHTEDLRLGFRYVAEIKTNWKLWFENYMECFHCPQVHPELCAVVPIYALALDGGFARDWEGTGGDTMVRELDIIPGAKTWTMDGQLSGPALSGLNEHELDSPQNGGMLRPSFFLNMHPDYVHTQRMLPTSPSTVEITWDYLFEPETMEREDFDACRSDEVASPRDYKVVSIGDQNIVITRDLARGLRREARLRAVAHHEPAGRPERRMAAVGHQERQQAPRAKCVRAPGDGAAPVQ